MDYKEKVIALLKSQELSKEQKEKLENIFPEFKESDNEKIKEDLIQWINEFPDTIWRGHYKKDVIAWLEKQGKQKSLDDVAKEVTKNKETAISFLKSCGIMNANGELADEYKIEQGEQNPTNKVVPKFKIGDWILYSGDHYEGVRHITKINENGYYIERNGLPHGIIPFNHEICMRLWTIQDAKDGDVLAEDSCIFIIQKLGDNSTAAKTYCTLYDDGDFDDGTILYFDIDSTKPATKEQCDLLFQKMKKAGYEWDAEKKELRKIKQEPIWEWDANTKELKKIEQETTWSEEDKDVINHLLNICKSAKKFIQFGSCSQEDIEKCQDWLKSIKFIG